MANLSNINGKFVVEQTTGYVGVGTTDPNFLIEAAAVNSEIALNSTSASIYRLRSTSSDSFIITKNGVGDRLVIDGSGNATFAGSVTGTIARFDTLNNNANSANIIYRSGTDTIVGGGSPPNKIYIQDGGNVGIGTASPDSLLHLASSFPEIRLEDSAYATNHYSSIDGNGGSGFLTLSADSSNTAANSAMIFKVDATERMRIDNS